MLRPLRRPLLTKDYPVYSLQRPAPLCGPGCGGWWVTLVNGSSQSLLSERPLTAEAPSATPAPEYVASLDFACVGWSPESITRFTSLAEGHSLLVAGKLLQPRPADTNAALLQYGALQVSDGFYSATASPAKEPVYSLTSTGIVRAVAPALPFNCKPSIAAPARSCMPWNLQARCPRANSARPKPNRHQRPVGERQPTGL